MLLTLQTGAVPECGTSCRTGRHNSAMSCILFLDFDGVTQSGFALQPEHASALDMMIKARLGLL